MNRLFILFILLLGCKSKKDTLFTLEKNCGIEFTNTVTNTKEFNIFNYRNFYNGGGVATGDLNNDGLPEVVMTSNMGENKLFLNKGDFKFEDITTKAGIANKGKWNTGVVMADINADGWLDIYICNAGINKWKNQESNSLFINNHDLTFTEKAKEYGLDEKGYTTHAAFFDYDLDGDLDCYILNNSFIPVNTLNYQNKRDIRAADWPVEDFIKGGGDKLLRNDNGKYADVSNEANIYGSLIGFGLGVNVGDINGDNYPDLYISNDFFEKDYLYINQKDGTFKEDMESWMQHISMASMGADIADVNNDGYPDIFTTDMLPGDEYRLKTTSSFEGYDLFHQKVKNGFYNQYQQNALQINNGKNRFLETAHYSGVAATDWSWGALIFDADNDGQNDLYVCNGIYKDVIDQDFIDFFANALYQRMAISGKKEEIQQIIDSMPSVPVPNKMYRNNGNLSFKDIGDEWGLSTPSFSNGAAYADLDNDGDLDLVVNNVNMPSFVYRNNLNEKKKDNKHISFLLKAQGQNSFAIGALIKLYTPEGVISREVIPSRGFQSSTDYKIVVGLGNNKIDSAVIIWPDGAIQNIGSPAANQLHTINKQPTSIAANSLPVPALVTEVNHPFDRHLEDDYVDFYQERNIPVMLSSEGPAMAIADVNNDGLDDVYIGGAKDQPGQLYKQTSTGFSAITQPSFIADKNFEDVAALFFDADADGDKDLFVGAGGSYLPPGDKLLNHRLYRNNGLGTFTKDTLAFITRNSNTSVACAYDYDNDGDEDLFVGGRNVSLNYGAAPASYIYENNGKGIFTDVTKKINPAISSLGMVTDAVWADIDNDKKNELIVVGEWMYPKIFSFVSGKANELNTNLADKFGWWQSIAAEDMDGDGKVDLILGNYGENFYLKPTDERPVKLWVNDFDLNTLPDKIFSYTTTEGKDVPVFLKRDFTEALPSFKKESLRHHAYAKKSVQQLFAPELINSAIVRRFNTTTSIIAYNNGEENFTIQEMPFSAQLSSINSMVVTDINGDGKKDIVAGGNITCCLPQFGRLDASYGEVLLNRDKRKFESLSANERGIDVAGMVRNIGLIKGAKNSNYFLFVRNNDYPVLYSYKNK